MMQVTSRTIEYPGGQGRSLQADLYLPSGKGLHPLVVGVSGGGWVRGHRRALGDWGCWLAARGFAFASIDYQRVEDGPAWPQNLHDVAAGLTFLSANAATLGLDPARIAVLGVSAGAHLAALALLSRDVPTPPVAGFAGIYGVYDLMSHWQADLWRNAAPGTDKTEAMLGAAPFDDPQRFHDASPLRQITFGAAMPVLLVWGGADTEVSPRQSEDFAQALTQARFPVRSMKLPDAGHMWFSEDGPEVVGSHSARTAPHLLRFLTSVLGQGAFEQPQNPGDGEEAAPVMRDEQLSRKETNV